MALATAKFNMPSKAGSGLTAQEWADLYLDKLCVAFSDTNTGWAVWSSKETIGTNTSTSNGCRTVLLKNTTSGKYLRIWCFAYSAAATISATTGTSGNATNLKLYSGNLVQVGGSSHLFCDQQGYGEIYFGVSDSNIGVDFGQDLSLSVGLFGLANQLLSGTTQTLANNAAVYASGATITVISDGSFFGVMRLLSGASQLSACFYAPDMIICANDGDSNTEGVISCEGIGDNFYFGNNDAHTAENYVSVIFNSASGTHDFRGWTVGINSEKDSCMASESSAELPCTALKTYLNIQTYSGSTLDGIMDGLNFKGWVNPNYVRSANVTVLPAGSKGMTFGNGSWLCTDAGTLLVWDGSQNSPFEAATN